MSLRFFGTLGGYFLEKFHLLRLLEPHWSAGTGLAYILFGFFLSAVGFAFGRIKE